MYAGLFVCREHQKSPSLSVRLEIDSRDDTVAETKRQHVVAPFALRGRHVDLDAVVKLE